MSDTDDLTWNGVTIRRPRHYRGLLSPIIHLTTSPLLLMLLPFRPARRSVARLLIRNEQAVLYWLASADYQAEDAQQHRAAIRSGLSNIKGLRNLL